MRKRLITFWQAAFGSTTWQAMPAAERRLWWGLLLVHLVVSAWFITRLPITDDESGYFGYTVRWAQGHTQRLQPLDDSKSPMVLPALLPVLVKPLMPASVQQNPQVWERAGRYPMYAYAALLAWVAMLWLRRWLGPGRWFIPLLLLLFDPLVLAYSMIIGTDLAAAAWLLLALYAGWRYTQQGAKRHAAWFALASAAMLVTKVGMVYAVPLLWGLLAAGLWRQSARWRKLGSMAVLWVGVVWLGIMAAYQFRHSFFAWHQLPQQSQSFQRLVQATPALHGLPVPLPFDFVSSFDWLRRNAEWGGGTTDDHTFTGVFVWNQFFTRGPVWWYYAATLWYKLPLLWWLLAATGLGMWLRRSRGAPRKLPAAIWWLGVPAAGYLLILSVANPFQIGVRHALPALVPGMLLLGGPAQHLWQQRRRLLQILITAHLLGLLWFWPNLIGYTNLLLWPKTRIQRALYDSSVSYGNSEAYLAEFLQKHPEYRLPTAKPEPGNYAIDLERLANPHNLFGLAWLNAHFTPVGQYRHTVLLFQVTTADLQQKGLLPASAATENR